MSTRSSYQSLSGTTPSNPCRGGHILSYSCFDKHQKFIRSEVPCKTSPCPHQEDRHFIRTDERCSECVMGDQYLCMRDEAEWKSLRAGQSIEMSMMRAFKILWTTKQDLAAMVLEMNLTKMDNITPVDNPALDIWDSTISMAENLCETMEGITAIYMHFWYSRSKKHSQRPIRSRGGILDQINHCVRHFEEISRIHATYKALWAADAEMKDNPMSPPLFSFDLKENHHIMATPYDPPANFWGDEETTASTSPIEEEPEPERELVRGMYSVGTPTDTPPMSLHSFMDSRRDWSESVMVVDRL